MDTKAFHNYLNNFGLNALAEAVPNEELAIILAHLPDTMSYRVRHMGSSFRIYIMVEPDTYNVHESNREKVVEKFSKHYNELQKQIVLIRLVYAAALRARA